MITDLPMPPDQAKRIVCQLMHQSSYFKGYLEGLGALGRLGFPVEDEIDQQNTLSGFFLQIGKSLAITEQIKTDSNESKN